MLTNAKILGKLEQLATNYRPLRFEKVADVPMELLETKQISQREPQETGWQPVATGHRWGGSWITGWFRGDVTLPAGASGQQVFLRGKTGGIEGLLIVDGEYKGTFNDQHPLVRMATKGVGGRKYHVAIEAYSGHSFPGAQPNETPIVIEEKSRVYTAVTVELEREDVSAFVYDLDVLLNLVKMLDANSLRRSAIIRELEKVWSVIHAFPAEQAIAEWRPKLAEARAVMAPLLAKKNGPTTPEIALVAHSHIDTAWLWPIAETRRKTGRTFSSMANLMERYPEVIFLQSAPVHAEMAKEDYPQVFEAMKKLVAAGRWEPNGGAWVEPDCNLTGGEALVRQFLVGINWTREQYGYSSDCLWQPDVFGYSAALPQILRGFNLEYFLTTKMAWNDTTRFPYDTFTWRGIDGSTVLTHLNSLPQFINSQNVPEMWNWAQHKDSEDKRLGSYGWGDGGGGPTMEDMEIVRRLADLEGAPKTYYTTVTNFMRGLRDGERNWPEWVGELYLELHRGTLTSIGGVKRGNRKTELALRDVEFVYTLAALKGAAYPAKALLGTWKELLINQFHDILPGTSIARVNDEALAAFAKLEKDCAQYVADALDKVVGAAATTQDQVLLLNSLSWDRAGELTLGGIAEGLSAEGAGVTSQSIVDVEGRRSLAVTGVVVPALGGTIVKLKKGAAAGASPFKLEGNRLETPHATAQFDAAGRIVSYRLKASDREGVRAGGVLNGFLSGEDVPQAWDNWDIDSDQELRMQPETRLVKREVVANGPLQLRIAQEYRIGRASTLTQHVVFHAASAQVTFETVVDWREKHVLLKTAFDVDVLTEMARHEIQFGHVQRPTHRNYLQDRARFEVCAHKWMDLSDNGFGVALLNDCKYGVGVNGGSIRLSLLKSGTHPDERGDNGRHVFTYALLPHEGPFSVQSVVRPGYELNVPVIVRAVGAGIQAPKALLSVNSPSVIVEAIKWAEDGSGFVVRLYEAGQIAGPVKVSVAVPVKEVRATNMLEEGTESLPLRNGAVSFRMRPFEIKTLKVQV